MPPSDEGLKRGKKKQKKNGKAKAVAEDRISGLSDEILHRVMSFMNTKYAVQTCVLSKRWKCLWKSLPYLNFSLQTFPFKGDRKEEDDRRMVSYIPQQEKEHFKMNYYGYSITHEEEDHKMISFANFITQVLSRRYHTDLVKVCFQNPRKIYFLGHKFCNLSDALEWLISYAVDRNVQQLTIESKCYNKLVLYENEKFHICQSLETFKFNAHASSIILPKFMSLAALKSLHLGGLEITKNWLDPMNLSGCPNLESLKLIDIHCRPVRETLAMTDWTWFNPRDIEYSLKVFDLRDKTLFVNAPNLKRLELSFRRSSKEDGCKVVIGAPGLKTFQYRGFYPVVCSSVDLASIDDVCFDIYNGYISEINPVSVEKDFDVNHEHVLGLINTFKAFRHAKSITLPWETVKALARFPSLLVENQFRYSNLKYLKIELQRSCNAIEIPGCILNIFLNSYTKLRFCQRRYG